MEATKTHEQVLTVARDAFRTGKTKALTFREYQLKELLRLFEENGEEILDSLHRDLRKSKMEATLYELELCKTEIKLMLKNLRKYAADEKLPFNMLASLDRGFIRSEPYGVVLVIGPWNYPFLLTIKPLIGAIAAGNCVVVKPSEVTPACAASMAKLLPHYIDPECYPVVLADVDGTKELLLHKFDYIFYTGSTSVGSSILHQAAPHLTPVTLELGGKSPCFIDDNTDFRRAANRIMWGKNLNMGQTCIAPDYLLCSKRAETAFVEALFEMYKEWYGEDKLQSNKDLPRIVNQRHFLRLKKLLDSTRGTVVFGGETDENDLWIEPTLVANVQSDDPLMDDEIFGPILPIITVNSPDDAIKFILSKPKPLALYVFSSSSQTVDKMLSSVSSGGSCVNDVVWQNPWQGLPFGGVGDSGMGNYHGKFTFDTFSHKRGVLVRSINFLSEKLGEARYPPYTAWKLKYFSLILNYFQVFNVRCSVRDSFSHLMAMILGAVILFLVLHFGLGLINIENGQSMKE